MDKGGIVTISMVGKFIRNQITDIIIQKNMEFKNVCNDTDKLKKLQKHINGLNASRYLWSLNRNLRELRDQIVGNQGEDLLFENSGG